MRQSARHLNRSRVGFRTIAVKPEIHAQGEINVTPLIDVVLVLLIIFMVVTPLLEKELSVFLPAERRTVRQADVAPTQLAVHVDDAGGLAINDRAISHAGYIDRLHELLEGREQAQRVVFVIASDGVSYPRLIEAMDGAKRAGALTVGLAVEAAP